MVIHRVCLFGEEIGVGEIAIGGEEAKHALKVKRVGAGDPIEVVNGAGSIGRGSVVRGGKGELIAFTKGYFATSDLVDEVPFYQGGVRLEGARYPIVCRIKLDDEEKLRPGIPMRVEFKPPEERLGRVTDYYFVLDE